MMEPKTDANMRPIRPYEALYIHIPFCAQRCNYCDFYTQAVTKDDQAIDRHVDNLIGDVRAASREGLLGNISTIYIGGGTPTFIGHKRLVKLAYTLSLSMNLHEDTEFTVEANPESITAPMLRDIYSLGVNRLSIGVQSFVNSELKALGRIHDSAAAMRAIATVRERFDNISIDLMCGIPGQTLASWQQSLDVAEKSDVAHISIYPLTIEDGSNFGRALANKQFTEPDEDLQAEMMEQAARQLQACGFERYEVASYAQPGRQCQHNIAYWTGKPYLGLGKGAAGMRESTTSRERLQDGEVVERLTPAQALLEDLMLGMRMSNGVSEQLLSQAIALTPQIKEVFAELKNMQLIRHGNGRYKPTTKAWLLGNELYGRIWALAYQ